MLHKQKSALERATYKAHACIKAIADELLNAMAAKEARQGARYIGEKMDNDNDENKQGRTKSRITGWKFT